MGQPRTRDGDAGRQPGAPVRAAQDLARDAARLIRRRVVRCRRAARRAVRRLDLLSLAVLAGLLGSGVAVLHVTSAAFSGTTGNGTNSWASGNVALTDDDSAVAMFTAGPIAPGATASRCIQVSYSGSLASAVRLYTTALTGTLGPDLQLVVQQSTGGSFADCTGFNTGAASTLYSGTVAGLAGQSSSYATGVACWSPAGAGESRVLKFSWTLSASVADSQQGATASVGFVWEAQS